MLSDDDLCYQAVRDRDRRLDGHFFVAVSSTRIYCRPICRSRLPRPDHCRFFASAAAAETAGFRPCLRCRPELAPGLAGVAVRRSLAQRAAASLAQGVPVTDLAAQLQVDRQDLWHAFGDQFGVTPAVWSQTRRRLLAKQLLTDTGLAVADIARASGFDGVADLAGQFERRYRLPLDQWRRRRGDPDSGAVELRLAYRPPLAWTALRDFLGRRAIAGVEAVSDNQYRRTVAIRRDGRVWRGWLTVSPVAKRAELCLRLSGSLLPVAGEVIERTRRLFDLDCQPEVVVAALGALAERHPGLRVPGAFDGLEAAVRAVLGQQITVQAASTLAGRVAGSLGEALVTPFDDLTHTFPDAVTLAATEPDSLGRLGVVRTRIAAIRALAQACAQGHLLLTPAADVDATIRALKALRGIGDWTAQYLAMRALAWPDAFPAADYGVLKALGESKAKVASKRAEAWRPWRSYAVMHLWQSLADG